MPDFLQTIRESLFNIGALALVASCALMIWLWVVYNREKRASDESARRSAEEVTNTMMLFQTMRDMLEQQKDIARQLNEHIDRKIAKMQQLVTNTLDTMERLRDKEQKLSIRLMDLRSDLESVQRQIGYLKEGQAAPPSAPRADAEPAAEAPQGPEEELEPGTHILHAVAAPHERGENEDLLEGWVGLDFGAASPELDTYDAPSEEPIEPVNAEAAREAFRALLDFDLESSEEQTPLEAQNRPAPPAVSESPAALGGNGRSNLNSVQKRVYEYYDAGMSVAQISSELGIGKGEIRLMLSLRKDKES